MKRILFALLSMLPLLTLAQGLNVIYSFSTFNNPSKSPYVEINLSMEGKSIKYIQKDKDKYQGRVEVITIIKKDTTIIFADKRDVLTPELDNQDNDNSIVDLQRIALSNGRYKVTMELRDKNTNAQPLVISDELVIDYPLNQIAVSDVQLIESYTKASRNGIRTKYGYDLIPYLFDAIPQNINTITFFAEVYNADKQFGKDSSFTYCAYIENLSTGKRLDDFQMTKKEVAKEINVGMANMDITQLPQGSYNMIVEARDKKNILYAYKKIPFVRLSSKEEVVMSSVPQEAFVYQIPDSILDENLFCLLPICSEDQRHFISKDNKNASTEEKRVFLYNFFRIKNPDNPKQAWEDYMKEVEFVNNKYSTNIKKGYQTDMGRVYLVYGKPTHIIDEKYKTTSGIRKRTVSDELANPEALYVNPDGVSYMPYQMWQYEKTPFGEVRRTFVFYAPQNNLMEYFLLHSNVKGEMIDMFWENTLTRGVLEKGVEGDAGLQFRRGY